ncbi:hypothetical protein MMC25_001881 [Agyrium rufum]|nr:hypothetical protein [Agyrium rufum]
MSTNKTPKSILKKRNHRQAPPKNDPRDARNLELALHHANIIQHRKDIEQQIYHNIETLIDFPTRPSLTVDDPAGHPSPEDVAQVKILLEPFSPSNLDALIEERKIDGKCGYVLCPKPRRVENTTARHRIVIQSVKKGRDSFRVVEKAELEKWCSDACGKRATYLRLQLSETLAWEREGTTDELQIPGEEVDEKHEALPLVSEMDVREVTRQLGELAMERGQGKGTFSSSTLLKETIEEHAPDSSGAVPRIMLNDDERQGLDAYWPSQGFDAVEGYRPRTGGSRRQRRRSEEEEDMLDTI